VVVGAEHVDAEVVAAVDLVGDVGDVTGDVGGVAVGLDDDAVLVVPEVGAAQPPGALGLVEVAVVLEGLDGLLHGTGLEQGVLVEEDVELGAELGEGPLDVGEHEVHALGTEDLLNLPVGVVRPVRGGLDDLVGDVGDVVSAVAVLRGGLTLGRGDERPGEPVDLGAVVVEVVLARDLCAAGGENAAERIADGGPPGTSEVDRAGRVGGDELQVDPLTGVVVTGAVGVTGGEDVGDEASLCVRGEADVDETGAGDGRFIDAVSGGERLGEPGAQVAGVGAGLLRGLQRDIGRVVTVLRIARSLDDRLVRDDGGVEAVVGEHGARSTGDEDGKISRSHSGRDYQRGVRGT